MINCYHPFGSAQTGQCQWLGKAVAWFLLLIGGLSMSFAQTTYKTYYVATNGSDANSGLSASSPLQTLSKVSDLGLQPGDSVLFRRGDTFRGILYVHRSGSAAHPIVFDAYSTGTQPIIAGSVPVTNWTSIGNNVWQATCTDCGNQVTGLHRNGAALPLGRYPNIDTPNKGYLTVQSHAGRYQITSQQPIPLDLNTGWQGGEVALRSTQWIIDRAGIDHQYGNSLNLFERTLTYPLNDGWGYFIQNHPATLNQPGEWCFDTGSKAIRLYDPVTNPNNQTITATAYRSAIDIANVSYIVIRNLQLTETLNYGLWVYHAYNLTFTNLSITHSGEDAVTMAENGNSVVLENCQIVDANNNGILIGTYPNVTLRNNTIRRIGSQPGRGKGGDGQYNGVSTSADQNVLIENNVIDSVGYNGLMFWNNSLVQRNVISNYCLTKSDGGGIYIWNGRQQGMGNIRVRSNIVFNGLGAPEGTPGGAYSGANGVFFDDCVYGIELTNNTTFNNHGLGFFLHAVSNMTIRGNTSFGNREGQLALTHNQGKCPPRGNIITNNTLVSRFFEEFNAKYESDQNDLPNFGRIDSNYYVRPFEKEFIIRAVWNYGGGIRGADFNREEWTSRFGQDVHSKASPLTFTDYRITHTTTPRFIDLFETDISGWSILVNSQGNGRADWDNTNRLDGGSMRVSFPQPSGQTWFYDSRVMVGTNAGVILGGKKYRLSFDAKATSNTKRVQAFLQTPGTPLFYFDARTMPLIDTTRRHYEVVFTPTDDLVNAQVGFQIYEDGQTIWFDNVSFQEVETAPVSPESVMQLIYNPTQRDSVVVLNGRYRDAAGITRQNSVTLAPFTSLVLLSDPLPPPAPVPGLADLNLAIQTDRRTMAVNDLLTVQLRLRSAGNSDSTATAQWTSRFPANLQFVGGAGLSYSNGILSGTVGRLTPAGDTTFVFQARPTAAGTYRLAAQIATATTTDPDSSPGSGTGDGEDDAATADFRAGDANTLIFQSPNPDQRPLPDVASNQPQPNPTNPDLSISMVLSSQSPAVNELVSCMITITNSGGVVANGVQVQDQLPAGLMFVNGTGWTASNSLLSSTPLSVSAGATVRLSFQVRVISAGHWVNQAQIIAGTPTDVDSTPGNGFTNGEDDVVQVDLRAR